MHLKSWWWQVDWVTNREKDGGAVQFRRVATNKIDDRDPKHTGLYALTSLPGRGIAISLSAILQDGIWASGLKFWLPSGGGGRVGEEGKGGENSSYVWMHRSSSAPESLPKKIKKMKEKSNDSGLIKAEFEDGSKKWHRLANQNSKNLT